jgi:ankyrin repeat protein
MAHLLARGATLAAEWPNNRFGDDDLHGRTALHAAAENDDGPMLRLLLAADGRAFLGTFDEVGRTPLMVAVDRGHEATVDLLIKAGSDVNAHDEAQAGDTAIIWAVERGHLGIVRRLLDAGADPTIPGWMGLTAIHRAQRGGDGTKPILELFRERLDLPGDQWGRLLLQE